jgi:hypothetical protein
VYAQEDSFKKDKGDIEEKPEVGVIRKWEGMGTGKSGERRTGKQLQDMLPKEAKNN